MTPKIALLIALIIFVLHAEAQSSQSVAAKNTLTVAKLKPVLNVMASSDRGKVLYKRECMECHNADGMGTPAINPPLVQTPYVLGEKRRLITILLHGITEKIKVNDIEYTNNMAPHNYLNDQQIADLLTYVRLNFGNKADAVTAEEVSMVRAVCKADRKNKRK